MTVNRGDIIHAVRVGQVAGRDHRASSLCWCEPSALLRDLASGATVWVHGATGEGDSRPDAGDAGGVDPYRVEPNSLPRGSFNLSLNSGVSA
jgi:hypothetical protein